MYEDLGYHLCQMANSPIRNYVTPGLTSWLVGGEGHGKVRMFTCDRDTRDWITPHSHRFNFTCLVLEGSVLNMIYELAAASDPLANQFCIGTLKPVDGGLGSYEYVPGEKADYFKEVRAQYRTGDTYSMTSDQIHSIEFNKNAKVLFLEGLEVCQESKVLEPWSNGARVPTFETRPWQFIGAVNHTVTR